MDAKDKTHNLAEDQSPEEPTPNGPEPAPADSESTTGSVEMTQEFGDIRVTVNIPRGTAKELFETLLNEFQEQRADFLIVAELLQAQTSKRPRPDSSVHAENEDIDEVADDETETMDSEPKRPAPTTKPKTKKTPVRKEEIPPKKRKESRTRSGKN